MRLERFSDVGHFEARVQSFLLEREAVHNLMLGIIGHLHSGTVKDPPMATVERGGEIQLVALRTPPHPLILSLPTTEEALDTLASALGSSEFPGVNGRDRAAGPTLQLAVHLPTQPGRPHSGGAGQCPRGPRRR